MMTTRSTAARPIILALALTGWQAVWAFAQNPELGLVPRDAFAVIQVRPADLWQSEVGQKLGQIYPAEARFIREVAETIAGQEITAIDSALLVYPSLPPIDFARMPQFQREQIIITTAKPYDRKTVSRTHFGELATARKHKGKTYLVAANAGRAGDAEYALHFVSDRTYLLVTPPSWMEKVLDQPARAAGPLAPAIELARLKHPIVIGLNLVEPATQRELKKLRSGPLPPVPFQALLPLLDARSATLVVDFDKGLRAEARLNFSGAEEAAAAVDAAQDGLALFRMFTVNRWHSILRREASAGHQPVIDAVFWSLMTKQLDRAARSAILDRREAVLRIEAQSPIDIKALRTQAQAEAKALENSEEFRQARWRRQSAANLAEIMRALRRHQDKHGSLPPAAICGKDGKPLLSWRVSILPHVGEKELYEQFKLTEPWDSPHNIKLLPKIPAVLQPVNGLPTVEPFATYIQAFVGDGASLQVTKGVRLPAPGTLVLAEASQPVSWTRPADLAVDRQKPLPGTGGGLFADGFHAAFADGSVRFLSVEIDQAALRTMLRGNGKTKQ